jgi:hypothetical protein
MAPNIPFSGLIVRLNELPTHFGKAALHLGFEVVNGGN